MHKKALRYSVILLGIPLLIAIGVVLFRDRKYHIISLALALAACVPFFLSFEKRGPNAVSYTHLLSGRPLAPLRVSGKNKPFFQHSPKTLVIEVKSL